MRNQNKILLKQTFLLFSISVLFFLLSFANEDSLIDALATYGILSQLYLFLMIIFFTPISIFYLLRIKKNIKLNGLNIAFKIFCWFLILTLLALFALGVYESFYVSYTEFYGLNIFNRIWISSQMIDLDKIINFLYYTPALIFVGLLYWAIRINKFFNIENSQKLIK